MPMKSFLKSAGLLSEFSRVVSNQPFTGSKLCDRFGDR